MKVFISWSGDRSRIVADALRQWIPEVIQNAVPWMSESDISAGARWGREIETELQVTRFGILCLTNENLTAPWLLFEAGALAKTVTDSAVVPYLIGLDPSGIPAGPLSQFQAKRANERETWDVMVALNLAMAEEGRPPDKLRKAFDKWWPDLAAVITTLPPPSATAPQRTVQDMVEGLVEDVRAISRTLADRGESRRYSSPPANRAEGEALTRTKSESARLLAQEAIEGHSPLSGRGIVVTRAEDMHGRTQVEFTVDGRIAGFVVDMPLKYVPYRVAEFSASVIRLAAQAVDSLRSDSLSHDGDNN